MGADESQKFAEMITGDSTDGRQPDDVSRYGRRVLLATVGLSPQVVTETAYALMVSGDSPFIPSEIIIISTTTGAEQAREKLLGTAGGIPWLKRLYHEYAGSGPPTTDFVTVADHTGMELDDIDSPESSAAFADKILETVRRITDVSRKLG
ncbi:MAG: CRISPR-associated ring nuclease [Actinobacteria bacterium]|nr:CRISPR-associated ring nuclease [Actinomycetota bacterium]MCL5446556.1 CRISPR-associated ring nuclease [Actinomycetota bacterium]